jgi:hypothetical protein
MTQTVVHEKAFTIGPISEAETPYPSQEHPDANELPVPRTDVGTAS